MQGLTNEMSSGLKRDGHKANQKGKGGRKHGLTHEGYGLQPKVQKGWCHPYLEREMFSGSSCRRWQDSLPCYKVLIKSPSEKSAPLFLIISMMLLQYGFCIYHISLGLIMFFVYLYVANIKDLMCIFICS